MRISPLATVACIFPHRSGALPARLHRSGAASPPVVQTLKGYEPPFPPILPPASLLSGTGRRRLLRGLTAVRQSDRREQRRCCAPVQECLAKHNPRLRRLPPPPGPVL